MFFVFGRYSFDLNIPQFILTSVVLFIALIGDKNEVLAISMCCIPLHSIIDFYLAIGICVIMYIFKNIRTLKVGPAITLGIIMVLWEVLHCILGELDIKVTIGAMTVLVYLLVVMSSDLSDVDYGFVTRSLAIASICVCVLLLADCIIKSNFNFSVAMAQLQRLGKMSEYEEASINPNTIGIINVLAMSGLLQLRIKNGKEKNSGMVFLGCGFLLIMGLLTASRTFLVSLIIMLLLMVWGVPGSINKKTRFFAMILFFSLILLLIYRLIFPENFEFFLNRFNSGNMWNGRDLIISDYNEYMLDNKWVALFGVGLSNFSEKVLYTYNISQNVPHNGIQETVVAWGLPGLLMVMAMIALMITRSRQFCNRRTLLNYIPLIVILAKAMAGQLLTSGSTMLILIFAYLSLCQNFSDIKKEKFSL